MVAPMSHTDGTQGVYMYKCMCESYLKNTQEWLEQVQEKQNYNILGQYIRVLFFFFGFIF